MERKHFEWKDEDFDIMDKMVDDHERRLTKLEKQMTVIEGFFKMMKILLESKEKVQK